MTNNFDSLASNYSSSLQKLPDEYINLIKASFFLDEQSHIVDIGCGSGLLTFPLSKISQNVVGLDISHNMIEIAKKQVESNKITWVERDINRYTFANSFFDLIIAYESIHLFSKIETLLQNCFRGLKKNGFVCMGWCFHNWEAVLKEEILYVFKCHDIEWGEWKFQKFDDFEYLLNSDKIAGLSCVENKMIETYQECKVEQIVVYLTSISKVIGLDEGKKERLRNDLFRRISEKHGNVVRGNAQFFVRYSQKK